VLGAKDPCEVQLALVVGVVAADELRDVRSNGAYVISYAEGFAVGWFEAAST
jgi:hypothetical protein